jgi:hypothetical protein
MWRGILLLVGITALVFGQVVGFDFVWDDHDLIETNPAVTEPGLSARLPGLLDSGFGASPFAGQGQSQIYYRPLTIISLALDHAIWGSEPSGFHLSNLVTHLLTALILWVLLIELGLARTWALAGSVIFLVHPIHVEPVAWVSGRTDLIATVLFLSSYWLYLRTLRSRRGSALPLGLLSLFTFLLALLGKEMAITLPLVFCLDYAIRRSRSAAVISGKHPRKVRRALLMTVASIGIALLYLGLRHHAVSRLAPGAIQAATLTQRLTAVPLILARGIGLMLFPSHLSPVRGPSGVASLADPALIGWSCFFAALIACLLLARRHCPFVVQPVAFMLLTMIPFLGLVPLVVPFADRFLYLPSVGFAWLMAVILARLAGRISRPGGGGRLDGPWPRRIVTTAVVALVILHGLKAHSYLGVWRDDVNLFSHILAEYPRSQTALNELGVALAKRGDLLRARDTLAGATHLDPSSPESHYNLAMVLKQLGDREGAIRELRLTLRLSPTSPQVPSQLAHLLIRVGRIDEAISEMREAAAGGSAEARAVLAEIEKQLPQEQ